MKNDRGVTLTELLIASVLATVAAAGVHNIMNATYRMERDMRRRAAAEAAPQMAALAMMHIAKRVEVADRIVRIQRDDIQLRIPPTDPSLLDDPTQYHWERYVNDRATDDLLYFPEGGCGVSEVLARQIETLRFTFVDEGLTPPGGPCFAGDRDCNIFIYEMVWRGSPTATGRPEQAFRGWVTSRQIADSDVAATRGPDDSGNQLFGAAPDPPAVLGC